MTPAYPDKQRLEGSQIRLIRIYPAGDDQTLKCDLVTRDLTDNLEYNALSYVWGSGVLRKELLLRKNTIDITENLYNALIRYRRSEHTQLLWADAICINQKDDVEKTKQVQMMKIIYQRASKVIIWLGEEVASDVEGLNLAKKLHSYFSGRQKKNIDGTSFIDTRTIDQQAAGFPGPDDSSWRSLTLLYGRPWFRRIWILQEFICGRHCIMWCGGLKFEPDVLMQSTNLLFTQRQLSLSVTVLDKDGLQENTNLVSAIGVLWMLKERLGQDRPNGIKLFGLLCTTRFFQATDLRDKVFAIVGLADGVHPSFIDYNLNDREVFIRTATFTIRDNLSTGLQMLGFARHHGVVNLPSWVPDWSQSPYLQLPLSMRWYNSIIPQALLSPPPEIYFPNSEVITIKGKLIDTVSSLCESPYTDPTKTIAQKSETWLLDLSSWLDKCAGILRQSPRYGSESQKEEALWRTLIFDTTAPQGLRTPDESYGKSYKAYRQLIDLELNIQRFSSYAKFAIVKESWSRRQAIYNDQSQVYQISITNFMRGRQFCSSKSGYIGWAPSNAQLGDKVCFFQGYPIPFVLRPTNDKHSGDFQLIGEAYIHGMMNGETADLNDASPEIIRLI